MNAALQPAALGRQAGGLALPAGILVVIAMMVVPLPVALLDVFFVGNIVLSLLVLMVALHSHRPLDFSSFPSLLLIATILRLALNVASTRIVLAEGHTGAGAAGHVIEAFSQFVIGGNFVVGLIVFAILVIINLVVVAKGAGRVSEVSARFTLDAMPGKQMAIDADLNAGLLDPEQAKARRSEVAEEADFYGAMDGASKFVKGDAVAGILILAINVLGGIVIGTAQHGLSTGEAAETYVRLSIGDGLVAQIPSLLLSIAAAIIVTRASTTNDMARMIGRQVNLARAWLPVAVVMLVLGLVPGMPNVIFLLAAAAAAAFGWIARKPAETGEAPREQAAAGAPALPSSDAAGGASGTSSGTEGITAEEVTDIAPLSLQIGYGLIQLAGDGAGGALVSRITAIRREVSKSLGIIVPGVRIRDDLTLPPNSYRFRIGQTIVAEDTVHPERKLAIPGGGSRRKLKGIEVRDPSFGLDAVWILPHQQPEAEADDHVVVEPEAVVATHLGQVLQKHAGDLIGPDDVQGLLDALSQAAPTLVQTVVPKLVPLHVLTAVMRRLLAERIPVSDLRRFLEGLALMSGRSLSPDDMAEHLRASLVPLLLQQIAPLGSTLPLATLEPELEQLLVRARRAEDDSLAIDPGLAQTLLREVAAAHEEASAAGRTLIIVVAQPLRRAFAAFLRPHLPDALALGLAEIPEARQVEIVRTIGVARSLPQQAGQAPAEQPA